MNLPTILVVDDDVSAIQLVNSLLADEADVLFARSGEAALAMLEESLPDLILLDVEMPGIGGLETCRRLKANPRTASVPVIFVTSFGDEQKELAAMKAGAADFLSKPLTVTQLVTRIHAHWRVQRQIESIVQRVDGLPMWPGDGDRPKVLIVDDDQSAVDLIEMCLRSMTAELMVAHDGERALEMARQNPPDVVLLDMVMPGMSGLEVLQHMRRDPVLRFTPIVVTTQQSTTGLEAAALGSGATDFMTKPYSEPTLQARVRNALRLKYQAEAARRLEREHWRRVSDERLAEVVANVSDAIITVDAAGDILLMNRAACDLLDFAVLDVVGSSFEDLLPIALPALSEGTRRQALQRMMLPRNGKDPVAVEGSWSLTGEGAQQLRTLVLRDLTDREKAEQIERIRLEAEAEQRARRLMLGFIAHEIGNPLNGVQGFSHLLLVDGTEPLTAKQRQRVEQIANCSNLMKSLLSDMSDISAVQAGALKVASERVLLDAVLKSAQQTVSAQADVQKVTLSLPSECSVEVQADERRLHQCLVNLLSNAIKYNRPEGRVDVTVSTEKDRIRIGVRDTGGGMTAGQLNHLFEPFNRLGRTEAVRGTGLGLVVTRMLMTAMNGEVSVQSEVGTGTEVFLHLPPYRTA